MSRCARTIAAVIVLSAAVTVAAALAAGEGAAPSIDPVKVLVGRLNLDKYKATIRGLTQFGDRRQGTNRNRAAVNWIEAQLKSYGCSNVSRLEYTYSSTDVVRPSGPPVARDPNLSVGGARYRGVVAKTGDNNDPMLQPD